MSRFLSLYCAFISSERDVKKPIGNTLAKTRLFVETKYALIFINAILIL